MRFFDWIGTAFQRFGRWTAGALVPMFVRPTSPAALAWVVHFLLVFGIALGLYYLQPVLGITAQVGRGPRVLRPFWLALLFLLAYGLLWSTVKFWLLLAPRQQLTDFPDLDAAWEEVLTDLQKAGIGIADTPIFLILGPTPAGAMETLFRAMPRGLTVASGTGLNPPLRAYANADGIYLAVPGASVLGDPARSQNPREWISPFGSIGVSIKVRTMGAAASIGMGDDDALQQLQNILNKAGDRPLNAKEREAARKIADTPPDNQRVLDLAADRLYHVCGLIAAARWPLCPLNGAILLVPLEATNTDEMAHQWGMVAQQELAVIEAGMKLRFPVYVLAGGIEELPGGRVFFERFGADNSVQRFGKGFPLNREPEPADIASVIEAHVRWVFENLIPSKALQLMRVDSAAAAADVAANDKLFRFLTDAQRRGLPLARLVSRATAVAPGTKPLFGGCYLWVLAKGKPDEAKFVREFFKKLESMQGFVAWTSEAWALDSHYRTFTKLGYAILGVVLLGLIALAGSVLFLKPPL